MRRAVVLTLVLLTAILVQTTVFARTLFGVAPDIVLLVVIALSLLEGPVAGAVSGFAAGLTRDFLLNAPKGVSGFAYLVVAYGTGSIRPYLQSTSVIIPIVVIFGGTLLGTTLFEIVNALLGRRMLPVETSARIVLLTSLYNALMAPFIYPLIKRAVGIYQRKQVYRW